MMEYNNRTTHWCHGCNMGFASRQSLCNHKKRCCTRRLDVAGTPMYEGKYDDVFPAVDKLNALINKHCKRSSLMQVKPYMIPPKCRGGDDDTPAKRIRIETPSQPQKQFDYQSRVNNRLAPVVLTYADNGDENICTVNTETDDKEEKCDEEGDDEEIRQLLKRLEVLSELITDGYRRLKPALSDTIYELKRLDAITEEESQTLNTAFYQYM